MSDPIEDALSLIEQNFEFLHVGKFLDEFIKRNDLSNEVKRIDIRLEDGSTYMLNGKRTAVALHHYSANQEKPTVFGYLIELNAIRGICMAMRDHFDKNASSIFKSFVSQTLGERYDHFSHILSLIRNVLSHNIQNEIRLRTADYETTQAKFMRLEPSGVAQLRVKYDEDFPESPLPPGYGFEITVNFKSLQPGQRFLEVISEWHLLMFSEFCFNLVKAFRKQGTQAEELKGVGVD